MTQFVGIYNADGTILGEIAYVARKLVGRGSCALCDITHSWTGRRRDFDTTCTGAGIEWTLLHRNEASPEQLTAAGPLPAVIRQNDAGSWEPVLGPSDLDECDGDPAALVARLTSKS
jgi:hypothetical protein